MQNHLIVGSMCYIFCDYLYTYTHYCSKVWCFVMFLQEASSAQQGCIYLIKNAVKTVILWNIIAT